MSPRTTKSGRSAGWTGAAGVFAGAGRAFCVAAGEGMGFFGGGGELMEARMLNCELLPAPLADDQVTRLDELAQPRGAGATSGAHAHRLSPPERASFTSKPCSSRLAKPMQSTARRARPPPSEDRGDLDEPHPSRSGR